LRSITETRHSKYVTFQLAEVAVTRNLFVAILDRIAQVAIPPPVLDGDEKRSVTEGISARCPS
jgi:hypothetical protein